jgi:hypothetical protein
MEKMIFLFLSPSFFYTLSLLSHTLSLFLSPSLSLTLYPNLSLSLSLSLSGWCNEDDISLFAGIQLMHGKFAYHFII